MGEPDVAPHFAAAHAELLGEDVPGLPALQLVFTLNTSQIGALSLAPHRLEPHGVREGALARKDALALQVGVDHGDDGFVLRHLPHDARNLREAGELGGALAAVPAHERVPATVPRDHGQGDEHAVLRDALGERLHLIVVGDSERMVRERVDEAEGDRLYGPGRRGVALLLGREQVVDARQRHRRPPPSHGVPPLRGGRTTRRPCHRGRMRIRFHPQRPPPRRKRRGAPRSRRRGTPSRTGL